MFAVLIKQFYHLIKKKHIINILILKITIIVNIGRFDNPKRINEKTVAVC